MSAPRSPTRTRRRRLGPRPAARRRRRTRTPPSTRCSPTRRPRRRLRRGPRGQGRRARRSRPGRRDARARGAPGARPRRLLRDARFAVDTADPAARRAAAARAGARRPRSRRTLLFFELEWAALDDERADELLATDGLDFARHHLRTARRYRPHLLTEPEEKILTEKALTGRGAWSRLFEELTSAITVDARRRARAGRRSRSRCRGCSRPTATMRRTRAERGHRGAGARPAHARATSSTRCSHDKAVDDRLRPYPHWLASRNLSNEASDESVAGADRRRPRALRAPAPLVPAQGAAARHRPARRLRPHGGRHRRRRARSRGREARSLVLDSYERVLPELGDARRALLRRALDRRAGAPEQARRRVLRLHRAVGAPVRDAQLHGQAPRRADARARARPRRPRRARRAAQGVFHQAHAADAGRDRVGVRRDARLRAAARAGRDARVAPGAARRVASRARSPPSSARSR